MSTRVEAYVESGEAATDALEWALFDADRTDWPREVLMTFVHMASCHKMFGPELGDIAAEMWLDTDLPIPDTLADRITDIYLESSHGQTKADEYGVDDV